MQRDVREARQAMNFSEWSSQVHTNEHAKGLLLAACVVLRSGSMPLPKYLWLHPGARPAPREVRMFCDWARQYQTVLPGTEAGGR